VNELPDFVIGRHGGTDRWHRASVVSAAVQVDRGFWVFKGQPGRPGRESVPGPDRRGRLRIGRPKEIWYSQPICSAGIELEVRLAAGRGLPADLDHGRDSLERWHTEQGWQHA
jgi:hypothetical protein